MYGEKGVEIVLWLENNKGTKMTSSHLLELFPDIPVGASRKILHTTLEVMAGTPEYIGRVLKREEGSYGGYSPVLLPEEQRKQSLEDLTLTAFHLYEVVRQSQNGMPLGAAMQAIAMRRGKKPDFTQVQAAVQQLHQHFGENFEVVRSGRTGQLVLKFVSEEDRVYSRHKKVK